MLLSAILCLTAAAGWVMWFARPNWFPQAASAAGLAWDGDFARTLLIASVIFTAAHLLLAATLVRSKTPTSRSPEKTWPEYLVGAATAVLFLALAVSGARGVTGTYTAPPGAETIQVYAHQFAWSFRYPGPDRRFGRTSLDLISDSGGNPLGLDPADARGRDDIVAATLRVPVGRPVRLLLHSRDVIHDFFVRELRTKRDVVPGIEIPLELQVDVPGQYEIACAELCGLGHSQMRSFLIAMPPAEFDRWKAAAGK